MTFYINLASTAARLIAKFGRAMTLSRRTVTGGSASSVTSGTASTATSTARAVALPMDASQIGRDIDGTAIRATDAMIYIAPTAPTAPQNGDTLSDGADTWTLLRVNPLRPGGVLLAYDCIGRK